MKSPVFIKPYQHFRAFVMLYDPKNPHISDEQACFIYNEDIRYLYIYYIYIYIYLYILGSFALDN